MEPRFIGLSTGRAGSRYLTALLNEAGVKTTHETGIWDCRSLAKFLDTDSDVCGEVSAHYVTQAEPNLSVKLAVQVWHFSRHPQPFVSSLIKFGFWNMDVPSIHPYLRRTSAEPSYRDNRVADSFLYWVDWNRRIFDLAPHPQRTTFRIEDVDRDLIAYLAETIGADADTTKIDPVWTEKQDFAEIPASVEFEVKEMMEVLGYAQAC